MPEKQTDKKSKRKTAGELGELLYDQLHPLCINLGRTEREIRDSAAQTVERLRTVMDQLFPLLSDLGRTQREIRDSRKLLKKIWLDLREITKVMSPRWDWEPTEFRS
jgi:hypothetical protein